MNTILSNKGYAIPKSEITNEQLIEIRKDLTVKPKETPYTCVFVDYSFPVYTENSKYIFVPRFWGIEKFGNPNVNKLKNGITRLNKDNLKLVYKPFNYQINALKDTLKNIKESGGTTLQVECGYGKTYCSIYIAYKLGLKTLVVVPRVKIVNQWKSEIQRFIPNARVGIIQGKVKEIDENFDFCIATLQTIGLKNFDSSEFKSFGLSIYDELPFFAANKMSTVLWKVYSIYNLGLSADPVRADGLDKIFNWYLGSSIVKSSRPMKRTHNPQVTIIYPPEIFYDKRIERTGNLNLAGMLNDLVKSKDRFKLIRDEIDKVLDDTNRKVLVMADRRQYLEDLYNETKEKWKGKRECLLFLGGMTKKKLRNIDENLIEEKYDIIFATYSLIGVGVSIDYLNTAIFATPKKDKMTEQAAGRIMRKDHKIAPIIIDIVDNNGIFKNQARARRHLYNRKGWNQKHVSLDRKKKLGIIKEEDKDKEKEENIEEELDKLSELI